MTADIHLTALYKEENKRISRGEARMRDGGERVIMVTKTTACCPVKKGRGLEEGQAAEVQPAKSTLKCEVPGGIGVEEM